MLAGTRESSRWTLETTKASGNVYDKEVVAVYQLTATECLGKPVFLRWPDDETLIP